MRRLSLFDWTNAMGIIGNCVLGVAHINDLQFLK